MFSFSGGTLTKIVRDWQVSALGASRHEWDCTSEVEAVALDGLKFPFTTVLFGVVLGALLLTAEVGLFSKRK